MAFDFNKNPVRLYGIYPQTPFPVEVSIYGYCQMSCSFCFANLGRDANERKLNEKNSTQAVLNKLDRAMQDPYDPIGFFLRERYPVCFSNTTDPFQRNEQVYRSSEAFLAWAKANHVPVFIQTRGNVLYQDFDRYAEYLTPGRVATYISFCQLDDALRKRHEPGAMKLGHRLELMRMLTDHGIPVIAACNPYLKDWVPDPRAYCKAVSEAGARGVWLEALHFNGAQSDVLRDTYREELLPKANLLPMYMIGRLKEWYAATEEFGLDFFPSPKWDAYFGHKAKHPECADPAWFGGKLFDFAFRFLKDISDMSAEHGKKMICFGWTEIEQFMKATGVPNPTLNTDPFWYCHNAEVKGDFQVWKSTLGKRAPLYEILRYCFNHPLESHNLVWYHPFVQAVWTEETKLYSLDDDDNMVGVFNPKIKHHGTFEIDESAVDWSVWPTYQ